MLIDFSITNFGSIKDTVTLSFEATTSTDLEDYYIIEPIPKLRLLKLGLIFGANASGKTTVLKALGFLREFILEPFFLKTKFLDIKPFLFDATTAQANSIFVLNFVQGGLKYRYELELNKNYVAGEKLYFYAPKKALVFERTTNPKTELSTIKWGGKIKIKKKNQSILEANTLWNNSVLGGYLKTNVEAKEMQEVLNWFEEVLHPMISPKTNLLSFILTKIEKGLINKKNIINLLSKADLKITNFDFNRQEFPSEILTSLVSNLIPVSTEEIIETGFIEDLKKEPFFSKMLTQTEINFQHTIDGSTHSLSYEEESEGTQRYFQVSGLLDMMLQSNIIFPIDELESSLHPDLFHHFILSFLVNSQSQLIATTHHRAFLEDRDIYRNDAIWFTEKQDNGSTDLYSLEDFDSSVIRDTSSVYKAYKIGKLGARPQLSDHYIDITNG